MRRNQNRPGLFQWAFLLAVAILAAGVLQSNTQPATAAAAVKSPVIATIRVSEVINGLDELKERENELKLFIDERQAEIKTLGEELATLVDDMNLMPTGSPQKKEAYQQAMRKRLNLEVEGEISSQLIDARRGEVYAEMFKRIQAAAQQLAQREGYHLVITDDSDSVINPDTERVVRAGILSRRVLFSDPSLDITDDLILTMNNAWKAGN